MLLKRLLKLKLFVKKGLFCKSGFSHFWVARCGVHLMSLSDLEAWSPGGRPCARLCMGSLNKQTVPKCLLSNLRRAGHHGLASGGVPRCSAYSCWERMCSCGEPQLLKMLDLRPAEADAISLPTWEVPVVPSAVPVCPWSPLRVPALPPAQFIVRANSRTPITFSTSINLWAEKGENAASRTPAAGR